MEIFIGILVGLWIGIPLGVALYIYRMNRVFQLYEDLGLSTTKQIIQALFFTFGDDNS